MNFFLLRFLFTNYDGPKIKLTLTWKAGAGMTLDKWLPEKAKKREPTRSIRQSEADYAWRTITVKQRYAMVC